MLNCTINSEKASLEFEGDVKILTTEICLLVREVYRELDKQDPVGGELFRNLMTACVTDPNAPTWRKDET